MPLLANAFGHQGRIFRLLSPMNAIRTPNRWLLPILNVLYIGSATVLCAGMVFWRDDHRPSTLSLASLVTFMATNSTVLDISRLYAHTCILLLISSTATSYTFYNMDRHDCVHPHGWPALCSWSSRHRDPVRGIPAKRLLLVIRLGHDPCETC